MKKTMTILLAALLLLAGCTGGGKAGADDPPTMSELLQPPSSAASPPGDSSQQPTAQTVTLVVPEGYTLARIGMTLEEKGLCTAAAFIEAAQNGDYSDFALFGQQAPNPNRCFALEGYLFPATYQIPLDASPEQIIRMMLAAFESYIDTSLREQIAASGYTLDEVLAMASIIEKESFGADIMAQVSSVLHNRLAIGMQIQCDVTINYVEGAIKPFITGDVDRYNESYNTFECPALPAGAICNPGLAAIRAALAPASTDYLYFVTDADGNYYFGKTWEEHQQNCRTAGL